MEQFSFPPFMHTESQEELEMLVFFNKRKCSISSLNIREVNHLESKAGGEVFHSLHKSPKSIIFREEKSASSTQQPPNALNNEGICYTLAVY